jgi:outer membrane receptor protein involved in Fe transport
VIDVQDLEILRGPQGTLYGKNTIAGAIKYVTRDIDGPATLTASVTGGNYGEHDEKLSFSTPVIDDHVYFGLALADLQHDGYGQVVAQPGAARVPTTPSARMSRTKTCFRGAPTSRSSGARVRSSRSSPMTLWIIPMPRRPAAQQLPGAAAQ